MPGTTDPVRYGRGSTLGIAQETTWGTAVSPRTNFLRLVSHSMRHNVEYAPIPDLGYQGQASHNSRRQFKGLESAGGDIEWIGSYDDSTVWMVKQAMGACTDAGGGAPYTHTCKLAVDLGEGLTLEVGRGDLPTTAPQSETFEGCLISKLELSIKAGDLMRCKASVIAETSAARTTASTPTYHTAETPIAHYHAGTFTWATVARKMRELTITLDNKLDARPALGAGTTQRPQRTGPTEVTFRAVLEVITADGLEAAYQAQTQSDATITFTSSALSAAITLHNAEIVSIDDPVNTSGILTQTVTWRCLSDGTDEGLQIVFTNSNALFSTN